MKKYLLFILSIVLIACNSEQGSLNEKRIYNNYVYNSSVSDSLNDFDGVFNKTRIELEFEFGRKANSCKTYKKFIKTSQVKEGVNNFSVKSEYLLCDALILLDKKTYISHNAKTSEIDLLAGKLDLRSFPSSLRPRLDDKNMTLAKIAGNDLLVNGNHVIYETADWYYKIELIAKTDINGNQKNDWLLWFSDESKAGNYRGYQTLIVYDVGQQDHLISAQIFPE